MTICSTSFRTAGILRTGFNSMNRWGIGESIETDVKAHEVFQIVGDLATACKHLKRDREPRVGAYVTSKSVTVQLGNPRATEAATTVTLKDGTTRSAEARPGAALAAWDAILRSRGLIPRQRDRGLGARRGILGYMAKTKITKAAERMIDEQMLAILEWASEHPP